MDENVWQVCQIFMAIIGIQTGLIIAFLWVMWYSMSQRFDFLEKRIDKLEEKMTDIDRRLCRLEGAFSSKECCILHYEHAKKAE